MTKYQEVDNITLYIVDDDENVRNILSGIFESENRKIILCESGDELFTALDKNAGPSVILLDMNIPKASGLSVMSNIKKHELYREYPVIFITAQKNRKIECRCLKEGAVDYITKPFDPEVVHLRVSNTIEQYRLHLNISTIYTPEAEIRAGFNTVDEAYKCAVYQMLSSLSTAIDAKDYYTRGHSSRVAEYCGVIGKEVGFSKKDLDILYHCALLHDIGKIGVSDLILRKEGRLSKIEFEVIKNHPVIGYDILKNITLMPDIARCARWHHERYDGKGYPDGLLGKDIPVMARIITVADSFDAMTSDRAYRQGMPMEKAKLELYKNKGTQFDPDIADMMIEIIDKGMISERGTTNETI